MPTLADWTLAGTTSSLVVASALLVTACSQVESGRNGPEFSVAFPDAQILVETDRPDAVRKTLSTVPLPETQEHHDGLLQLLKSRDRLTTDQLLLLTEAVALPGRTGDPVDITDQTGEGTWISIVDNNGVRTVRSRGIGRFAPVIDELLAGGAPKLTDPSPSHFGQLVGATQTSDAVKQLAATLTSEAWYDGTTDDLRSVLDATASSSAAADLCADVLLPAGRLSPDGIELALTYLGFDDARLKLLSELYGGLDSLSFERFLAHIDMMSFDAGRIALVHKALPLFTEVDGRQVHDAVAKASFDEGRTRIVSGFGHRIRIRSDQDVTSLIALCSFDSGKKAMLETLTKTPSFEMTPAGTHDLVSAHSFDAGRNEALALVAPRIRGTFDADATRRLMDLYSFDAGRQRALELLAPTHVRIRDAAERERVLEAFTFDSGRKAAERLIDR